MSEELVKSLRDMAAELESKAGFEEMTAITSTEYAKAAVYSVIAALFQDQAAKIERRNDT